MERCDSTDRRALRGERRQKTDDADVSGSRDGVHCVLRDAILHANARPLVRGPKSVMRMATVAQQTAMYANTLV
jgi:hypothetical protein